MLILLRYVSSTTRGLTLSEVFRPAGLRGCFRSLGEFSRSGLPYLRSLTRSRQFRNEIHGDPYTEAFTRRFSGEDDPFADRG